MAACLSWTCSEAEATDALKLSMSGLLASRVAKTFCRAMWLALRAAARST